MLSEPEKEVLLQLARQSIESAVSCRGMPEVEVTQPSLQAPSGAFVTLHEDHELRGCIGYAEPLKPLYETVLDAAAKAATEDPRFSPIAREELPFIEIEISVLSPLNEIKSVDEIEIGRDGLVVELGRHRGLLLPQVASQAGWDSETFLLQTFRKSGLPERMMKLKELKIYSFTAQVFSEHQAQR